MIKKIIKLEQKKIDLIVEALLSQVLECVENIEKGQKDDYGKYFDLMVELKTNPLTKKPYKKQRTKCPKGCGNYLYNSDVKAYKYVCLFCDENID